MRAISASCVRILFNGTAADAAKMVRDTDRARADYLKRSYHISHEEPTRYDLVINTDAPSIAQVVGVIASAAGP